MEYGKVLRLKLQRICCQLLLACVACMRFYQFYHYLRTIYAGHTLTPEAIIIKIYHLTPMIFRHKCKEESISLLCKKYPLVINFSPMRDAQENMKRSSPYILISSFRFTAANNYAYDGIYGMCCLWLKFEKCNRT